MNSLRLSPAPNLGTKVEQLIAVAPKASVDDVSLIKGADVDVDSAQLSSSDSVDRSSLLSSLDSSSMILLSSRMQACGSGFSILRMLSSVWRPYEGRLP